MEKSLWALSRLQLGWQLAGHAQQWNPAVSEARSPVQRPSSHGPRLGCRAAMRQHRNPGRRWERTTRQRFSKRLDLIRKLFLAFCSLCRHGRGLWSSSSSCTSEQPRGMELRTSVIAEAQCHGKIACTGIEWRGSAGWRRVGQSP